MPQMAPMNWLSLFLMFIIVFMIFNSLNYFCFLYTPKTMKMEKSTSSINWKW
uniref:ATP synthase complex subunit 8 n=1 Tax=Liogluta microptera TaxID=866049 RepID=A0A0S2M7L2_LIOMI|nr:ATP synthase F0 subunit 8 [Liogluta microptera]ALO70665.1 ATP synthase F0 subunit 8 [Liogluta microptera]